MPLTMSDLSVPAFVRGLEALSAVLTKATEHAAARKLDEAALLQARIYPDMFPLTRQVQIACDAAKGAVARLSGTDIPSYPDTETTFAGLQERIGRTLDFVRSIPTASIDGSEQRPIAIKMPTRTLEFTGEGFLLSFALPNFYFHLTTAYALLRHGGVELGKRDYLGAIRLA